MSNCTIIFGVIKILCQTCTCFNCWALISQSWFASSPVCSAWRSWAPMPVARPVIDSCIPLITTNLTDPGNLLTSPGCNFLQWYCICSHVILSRNRWVWVLKQRLFCLLSGTAFWTVCTAISILWLCTPYMLTGVTDPFNSFIASHCHCIGGRIARRPIL